MLVGDVLDGALVVDVLDEVVLGDVVLDEDVGRSTGAVTVIGAAAGESRPGEQRHERCACVSHRSIPCCAAGRPLRPVSS